MASWRGIFLSIGTGTTLICQEREGRRCPFLLSERSSKERSREAFRCHLCSKVILMVRSSSSVSVCGFFV